VCGLTTPSAKLPNADLDIPALLRGLLCRHGRPVLVPRMFRGVPLKTALSGLGLHSGATARLAKPQVSGGVDQFGKAPPAGFEPAHTAPEAVALSPELWGLTQHTHITPTVTPRARSHDRAAAGPQSAYQDG
jgi:hypothetical protein